MVLYKIFEKKGCKLYNLFHSMESGSREVEIGVEYHNRPKMIRDGSESKWYQSGIHAHYSVESTLEWLKKHSRDNRAIYVCEGEVREDKATSKGKVALCDSLTIVKEFDYIGYIHEITDECMEVYDTLDSVNDDYMELRSIAWDSMTDEEKGRL